jgi:hypothetical protein
METIALLGSITGLGLMAGIRLYATVLSSTQGRGPCPQGMDREIYIRIGQ